MAPHGTRTKPKCIGSLTVVAFTPCMTISWGEDCFGGRYILRKFLSPARLHLDKQTTVSAGLMAKEEK
jgi:hypothetical protein